jgi:hypothetical protein
MADSSGRDPGKDVLDLIVGQRRVLWTAQEADYIGSGSPTFLMADESEINVERSRLRSYTGS